MDSNSTSIADVLAISRKTAVVPNDRRYPRVYSLCSFDAGLVMPRVELIDAETDEDAVAQARCRQFAMRRELWDRHRLVATIPPGI